MLTGIIISVKIEINCPQVLAQVTKNVEVDTSNTMTLIQTLTYPLVCVGFSDAIAIVF